MNSKIQSLKEERNADKLRNTYDEIVNEAYSHQAGEYITSLAKLANLSRAEIVELAMTYSDEVNFAEAVVEKAK